MKHRKGMPGDRYARFVRGAILSGAVVAAAGPVQAVEINTGNEDISIRWDNTVRYNLAERLQGQDAKLIGSRNNNDGDLNFKKNSIVSNRIDLLSEFDLVYRGNHGLRLSAAAWGDEAYNNLSDHSAASSNHLVNGVSAVGLSSQTARYNRGVSGEMLDAFVFTKLDIGDSPLYLKLGRHSVFWGESLFTGGAMHGVAYAQSPLDMAKGLSIPGAEAKELFMPLNNVSANFQPMADLSIAAQYFLDWKPFRYPEAGSYLGFSDAIMGGGESIYTPMGRFSRLGDITPAKQGDFGLSARWSPEWLDGTVGVYYRNFTDKNPQTVLDIRGLVPPAAGGSGGRPGYLLSYGDNIDLFGVSLSKNIGGLSFGTEVSYRQNMPLASDTLIVGTPATVALANSAFGAALGALRPVYATAQTALPSSGDTGAARGDTAHAVFNVVGEGGRSPIFDSLAWKAELTWSTWASITQHEELFKGRSGYRGADRVTKDAWGFAMSAEPKWFRVWSGTDVSLPVSFSTGLYGTSAVAGGGSKDAGSYSVGVAGDLRNQYRFDLKYVGFFGKLDASNPTSVVANSSTGYLRDRGMLVFTFKTTF